MQKIVINTTVGGFSLSKVAFERLVQMQNPGALEDAWMVEDTEDEDWEHYPCFSISRDDPQLIEVVEELGTLANPKNGSQLKVVEIPDNVKWYVHSYEDGTEAVHEEHRVWK